MARPALAPQVLPGSLLINESRERRPGRSGYLLLSIPPFRVPVGWLPPPNSRSQLPPRWFPLPPPLSSSDLTGLGVQTCFPGGPSILHTLLFTFFLFRAALRSLWFSYTVYKLSLRIGGCQLLPGQVTCAGEEQTSPRPPAATRILPAGLILKQT